MVALKLKVLLTGRRP